MENYGSFNFYHEKNQIRKKSSTARYPLGFLNIAINDFESKEHDPGLPSYLSKDFESKPIVLNDVPFCIEKEKVTKQLLQKSNAFTKEKHDFEILWKSKRVRQLFPLKKKGPYPSCKIYEGVCFCKENYIGETKQNVTTWNEHKIQTKIQN